MIAYDYPLAGLFWTMVVLFFWIAWLGVLFSILADIFRSDDLGGAAKAVWTLVVVIVPMIGVMAYLLVRGEGMGRRRWAAAQEHQAAMDAQIRSMASPSGAADELAKLSELQSSGVITPEEFEVQKRKILS